ncbi:MAG TPA: CoA transferase [Dehalococcoidia bacterium]|nr:CoA transferase [Dehalococcoidia bacterium]
MSTERPRAFDLTTSVGGGYAAKLLTEVGWDVVQLEPEAGAPLRHQTSRWGGGEGGAHAFVNHGKRSITTSDRSTIESLAAAADVVIGDFSAAGLAEAQLPADIHSSLQPRFVVTSVSAFGLTGPDAELASADIVVQAASGLMFLTGEHDEQPMQLPPHAASMTGGLAAGSATLSALRSARSDGELRRVDVSIVEAMASLTHGQVSRYVRSGEVARREQRIKQALRMVPSSDGYVYCAPGAVAAVRMEGIATLLDEPRLAEERFQTAEGRMQNWDEYLELFVPPFATKPAQTWFEEADALHLTFALVQSVDDLFTCPQLTSRDLMREIPGPNGASVQIPGRPFKLWDPPEEPRHAPQSTGEHTDQILSEWLG